MPKKLSAGFPLTNLAILQHSAVRLRMRRCNDLCDMRVTPFAPLQTCQKGYGRASD